ncbi:MAG TPA: hypothetical protein VFS43_44570 [Polyangiaceae bacterium]|nr:hypothetical protein [Polyangiaceae bacterium]
MRSTSEALTTNGAEGEPKSERALKVLGVRVNRSPDLARAILVQGIGDSPVAPVPEEGDEGEADESQGEPHPAEGAGEVAV